MKHFFRRIHLLDIRHLIEWEKYDLLCPVWVLHYCKRGMETGDRHAFDMVHFRPGRITDERQEAAWVRALYTTSYLQKERQITFGFCPGRSLLCDPLKIGALAMHRLPSSANCIWL